MEGTGVFATTEEQEELRGLLLKARTTPMIKLSSASRDFASIAWERVQKRCHEFALGHGLPEVRGYYGVNEEGEFIKEVS